MHHRPARARTNQELRRVIPINPLHLAPGLQALQLSIRNLADIPDRYFVRVVTDDGNPDAVLREFDRFDCVGDGDGAAFLAVRYVVDADVRLGGFVGADGEKVAIGVELGAGEF
jgi:hypothetical protein